MVCRVLTRSPGARALRRWTGSRAALGLIVTMDDTTNEHYSMFFVEQEGAASSLQGVREVIQARGLFSSFYSDRGSHYWYTPEAAGSVSAILCAKRSETCPRTYIHGRPQFARQSTVSGNQGKVADIHPAFRRGMRFGPDGMRWLVPQQPFELRARCPRKV